VGRLLASRAFGVRGVRASLTTTAESGRAPLAFARAGASIVTLYLACALLFTLASSCGGKTVVDETSMRVTVAAGGPAAEAGVRDGDRIVALDGEEQKDWTQLKLSVGAHKGARVTLTIERDGTRQSVDVPVGADGKIRVGPFVEHRTLSLGEAFADGFPQPAKVAAALVRGFARVVSGSEKPEVSGPVGISREVAEANAQGSGVLLGLIAVLASYQAVFVDLVLLLLATITSLSRKMVPSGGKSS